MSSKITWGDYWDLLKKKRGVELKRREEGLALRMAEEEEIRRRENEQEMMKKLRRCIESGENVPREVEEADSMSVSDASSEEGDNDLFQMPEEWEGVVDEEEEERRSETIMEPLLVLPS